jgi:hypothetical protein
MIVLRAGRLALWSAAVIAVSGMLGCGDKDKVAEAQGATSEISVLIDLSETWLTPASKDRNLRLLQEIGGGTVMAAEKFEPPVAVQYRVIGQGSLGREPLCDAVYRPSLIPTRNGPGYEFTSLKSLKLFLGKSCPELIIRQPAEPMTEISAAIASVTAMPSEKWVKRLVIIASDFREETLGSTAPLPSLAGYRILLIYRPLNEDHLDPAAMAARIEAWRQKLTEKGATVTTTPDTALKRATVAKFLMRKKD